MNKYYECHITMIGLPEKIRPVVEITGWKFSAIDGDPVMGDGIKCYATKMFHASKPELEVLAELLNWSEFLQIQGCNVVRKKIEMVIYDDRSSKITFVCNGGCQDCHLDDRKE